MFMFFAMQQPEMITQQLEGWTLKLEADLVQDADWKSAKAELTRQLQNIERVVPDGPLAKLKGITIWVHRQSTETPCMAYHPDRGWLVQHKQDPRMAKCVELANVKNFVSWTYEQPWMVLHELAHSYHDQTLADGFGNKEVKTAFDQIVASKKYESVLHWNGKQAKHYALNNPMEFFAESTESYFGMNDFFPFVNAELATYDPNTYALMQKIWGVRAKRSG